MVQEALTNVARHAHATDVCIDLRVQNGQVVLTVEDNGIGLPSDALRRQGHWGLRGLRERVTQFGGHLTLDNAPGSGARLRMELPVNATEGLG
jgi:signal transduction histidine kinase